MRLCKEHWAQLRQAMVDRCIDHLTSDDSPEALRRVAKQLASGEQTRESFDPLMNANFAIWGNALQQGGAYLMTPDEQGNARCPICESEKHGGYDAEWWIRNAADEQRKRAEDLGLVPKPS